MDHGARHTAGVIFRDMKPENWLLLDKGNLADTSLKLVDFGLAKKISKNGPAARTVHSTC